MDEPVLIADARLGVEAGALAADTDRGQLAMESGALLTGADLAFPLHGDAEVLRRMRASPRDRLGEASLGADARLRPCHLSFLESSSEVRLSLSESTRHSQM